MCYPLWSSGKVPREGRKQEFGGTRWPALNVIYGKGQSWVRTLKSPTSRLFLLPHISPSTELCFLVSSHVIYSPQDFGTILTAILSTAAEATLCLRLPPILLTAPNSEPLLCPLASNIHVSPLLSLADPPRTPAAGPGPCLYSEKKTELPQFSKPNNGRVVFNIKSKTRL